MKLKPTQLLLTAESCKVLLVAQFFSPYICLDWNTFYSVIQLIIIVTQMIFNSKCHFRPTKLRQLILSGSLNWRCQSSNSSKLNYDKSESLLIGSKVQLARVDVPVITTGNSVIHLSEWCRNLGVMFDSTTYASMSVQVSAVCKSLWYQLRNLGVIRKHLTPSATEKIVSCPCISSRLDFGNSLLYQLPQTQCARSIQKLQNTAARIVTLINRITHITPVLHFSPLATCPFSYCV